MLGRGNFSYNLALNIILLPIFDKPRYKEHEIMGTNLD
jgi:hypothetical protein